MTLPSLADRSRIKRTLLVCGVAATALVLVVMRVKSAADVPLDAIVSRGTVTAQLTMTGVLKPIQSLTYRSPVAGRDTEILQLVPEGSHVKEGDLLVRLDTSELEREIQRVQQELRQAQLDLQTAETDRQDAAANVRSVAEGEGALTVDEARTRFQLTQKKVTRLQSEYEQLKPLLDRGYLTKEELSKTADALDQAEEELGLARKRLDVTVQLAHPRETQRAALQLAQKESQVENVRARVLDAGTRLQQLQELVTACAIYARRPGLVVYEELLSASPRRKVRVGDRVSSSQGLITIPEVNRMLVEGAVSEAEVHRVQRGQAAIVHLEAFPDLRLTGTVARVGTMASASADHPLDDKRFDLVVELDPTSTELRPEMTARADIAIGTTRDGLLIPVNAVFQDHGVLVAHVRKGADSEVRRIAVGDSDDRVVVVTSGLREGERVLLVEPSTEAAPATSSSQPRSPSPEGARGPIPQ